MPQVTIHDLTGATVSYDLTGALVSQSDWLLLEAQSSIEADDNLYDCLTEWFQLQIDSDERFSAYTDLAADCAAAMLKRMKQIINDSELIDVLESEASAIVDMPVCFHN